MKISIAAIVILIFATTLIAGWPDSAAAQGGVNVLHQGVENQFPEGLRFHIQAESSSPIEEIRVYVRKLGQSSRSVYRTVEFEPGSRINGEALFQSKTSNEYIPTGTRLSYYFDIRTADGEHYETEPEILVYLNRGLDWDSVSNGLINVYFYHHQARSEERARQVLEVSADTYHQMQPILGVDLTEPLNLVVYSDYSDMRLALRTSSRVAQQHLRTLGQAFTNERTLLVDGSNDSFVGDNILTTTAHEFTHLLVADAAGSAFGQVPTWLNEGLAVYSEGQGGSAEFDIYVNTAIRNNEVPPLSSLRTFSGTPQETLRNYGLGASAVLYMLDTYGFEPMAELFDELGSVHNFEKALEATYGITIMELDNQWRESLGLAPRELSTPALPAFQAIPTRRPTPTPKTAPVPAQASSPQATTPPTPTSMPDRLTYTPAPVPTTAAPVPATPSGGGCSAPPPGPAGSGLPTEMASAALLAGPLGLLALGAARRRRRCPDE